MSRPNNKKKDYYLCILYQEKNNLCKKFNFLKARYEFQTPADNNEIIALLLQWQLEWAGIEYR